MIPQKLYIPTSTLNFNNIMSSESLSPASFYSERGFGQKRFVKVPLNNLDNRIVLYPKYPIYDIDDKELENYPMVIEVMLETLKEDIIKENDELFYSEETIYLNPFSTKIIFRSETEKINTLSRAEPSIETKMVPLYEDSFVTLENIRNIESFKYKKNNIEDSNDEIFKFISEDRRINKLKGLLYAYLIASNKSVSKEIVLLKKNIRILRNILSAIIVSPDNRPTTTQAKQLKTIYGAINYNLESIFLTPVLKAKDEKYQTKKEYPFANILKEENLWKKWISDNNYSKFQVSEFISPPQDKEIALNNHIQYIQDLVSQATFEQSQNKVKCDSSDLPQLQNKRISTIPGLEEYLVKLFNEYLEEAYNSYEFIQSRYEFAKSGGKIFRDELKEQWEGSPMREYINALLKNLNEFSAFDLKSINNNTLESFAAFCQKGDSDLDKLEDYLISNEIGDFRIAFSLWGSIFGFANMPKTLTNKLFQSNDLEYISHIYKHIFKQLHSIELEGKFEKSKNMIQSEEPKSKNIIPEEDKKPTASKSDNSDERKKLKNYFPFLNDKQANSLLKLFDKYPGPTPEFFSEVLNIPRIGQIKLGKIENDKKKLNVFFNNKSEIPKSETKKPKKNRSDQLDIQFSKPDIGKEFYKDSAVMEHIKEVLPNDEKIQKTVKDEIDWIQKVHKEGGYRKKTTDEWIKLTDHSNSSVIKHFENNAKDRIDPQLLNKIVLKLKELYKVNE